MTIVTKTIVCKNEIFELTNQRVLYWKSQESLVLSDLHIGKSAHFQKSGIAIPSTIQEDLDRLEQLINHFKVKTLLIVGDLFHALYNKELDNFKNWLTQFNNLKLKLIKGNHDRLTPRIYEHFNLEVFSDSLQINNIKFIHDSVKLDAASFIISGHIHPGVFIKGKGKQKLKLPCFQMTKNQLILPAFSLFTGLNTTQSLKKCQNFCFTDDGLFEMKSY